VVTIYEVDCQPGRACAHAVYNFRWTPQRDHGVLHPTIDYPGVPVDRHSIVENHGVLQGVKIPVRPHFGVIALAPAETGLVDSVPPSCFGGNLDNWRIAKGAPSTCGWRPTAACSRSATRMPRRGTASSAAPPSNAR
jgi:hypothetical protein